jgi:hypothetical protein
MDHQDLLKHRPRAAVTRFELAAVRMADAWLEAGRVDITPDDLAIAREFLEGTGSTVRITSGALLRLRHRDGRAETMTREAMVVLAFRRLALRSREDVEASAD